MKTIKIDAASLAKYRREMNASNALARRAKARREAWGLPEASEANAGEWIVTDGNSQPIARSTVSHKPGYTVKDTWQARLT